jgi:hypothetical protein
LGIGAYVPVELVNEYIELCGGIDHEKTFDGIIRDADL